MESVGPTLEPVALLYPDTEVFTVTLPPALPVAPDPPIVKVILEEPPFAELPFDEPPLPPPPPTD